MWLVDYIYGRSKMSEAVREIMISLRLYYPYNMYLMIKGHFSNSSSDFEKESKVYFLSKSGEIEKILSFLEDDLSKKVFLSMINLRQKYDYKYLPPQYNYFDHYFPLDIIKLSDSEVFLDGGAFTGDTALEFIKMSDGKYKRIVEFEPDPGNLLRLNKKLKDYNNVIVYEAGIANENGEACFNLDKTGMYSSIVQSGTASSLVKLVRIDDVQECNDTSFIKMDIEGAELGALKGAEQTIKRNKPKLAISIYHSNADMIEIPLYLHSIVPEYKFYVRAHCMGYWETVLYAVIE